MFHDARSGIISEMIALEANARVILTDSGGVQKEAYFLRTPCVIPRNEVEWVELVDLGWATLTGKKSHEIINAVENALNMAPPGKWPYVYGDGHAGDRIGNFFKVVGE